MRDIQDILYFRSDISPFLVHLTRDSERLSAKQVLTKILEEKQLISGSSGISDARFGIRTINMTVEDKAKYFGAISFTETPLNEIQTLLEIERRVVNLRPYGLVFLKDLAVKRGVEPVFYLNNTNGDKDAVVRALCSLIENYPNEAAQILPLIAVFGKKLQPPGAARLRSEVDFKWEREWRYPSVKGSYELAEDEIFIGLCPHDEIDEFKRAWPSIDFIDPTRNMKWYATKLIKARHRLNLKHSVV